MNTTKQIIIVDLEATCWEGETAPAGQVSEIIEIGICVLDTETGNITKKRGILVKPTRSEVSPFCTQLTTITQELLDNEGVSFAEALRILHTDYDAHNHTWVSYGAYDIKMMKAQCKARDMDYPMSQHHMNVKTLVTEKLELKKNVGMKGALQILNIPLEGTHHRGVDDANNIAKILYKIIN